MAGGSMPLLGSKAQKKGETRNHGWLYHTILQSTVQETIRILLFSRPFGALHLQLS